MISIVCPTLDMETGKRAVRDAAKSAGVTVVHTNVTLDIWRTGGCKPANVALQAGLDSGSDYICYINDDVWFPQHGWLDKLITAIDQDPLFAAAGPSGACAVHPQRTGGPHSKRGVVVARRLSYFCVLFKRSTLEQIGLFDEDFHHWGCDTDHCERINYAGLKCIWVRHSWVDHHYIPAQQKPKNVRPWKRLDVATFNRKQRERENG